jgi:hypothetical protein
VSKDVKAGKIHVKDELSDEKKRKIKKFVIDYMDKVMARRAQKLAAKQPNPLPGPSDSVSTGTPQVPGSTPQEPVPKEMSDTPTPTKSSLGVSENGDSKVLSPTEFLKTLERDGLLEG